MNPRRPTAGARALGVSATSPHRPRGELLPSAAKLQGTQAEPHHKSAERCMVFVTLLMWVTGRVI